MLAQTVQHLRLGHYHLNSIWLFTFSDLKTIVGPQTIFGILNAAYAPIFGIYPSSSITVDRMFATGFWIWVNLLPFVIDNQRQAASIEEDRLNKPWRPMPSKRLPPRQAKRLMFAFYGIAFIASTFLGGVRQCLSLMLLGFWYNDSGGAANCVSRNLINAGGFVCFASGAMEVALGGTLPFCTTLAQWLLVIGGVVVTTVQLQDLHDQAGDRSCGRSTLPILVGDWNSRWMTALPMGFWSVFCPLFWRIRQAESLLFAGMGLVIAVRTLSLRQLVNDKTTFKLWNAWMVLLYSLPIIGHLRSL